MTFRASRDFWSLLRDLPTEIQEIARKNYDLLKHDPQHPSLRFKRVGRYWTARVGHNHRAVGVETDYGVLWFWIGRHDEYERIIR